MPFTWQDLAGSFLALTNYGIDPVTGFYVSANPAPTYAHLFFNPAAYWHNGDTMPTTHLTTVGFAAAGNSYWQYHFSEARPVQGMPIAGLSIKGGYLHTKPDLTEPPGFSQPPIPISGHPVWGSGTKNNVAVFPNPGIAYEPEIDPRDGSETSDQLFSWLFFDTQWLAYDPANGIYTPYDFYPLSMDMVGYTPRAIVFRRQGHKIQEINP